MSTKPTIVILAGAGASTAVNPEKYPTTKEFYEKLPDRIINEQLFKYTVDFIHSQEESSMPVDVEKVLWTLNELHMFCLKATDTSVFPGWMIFQNKLPLAIGNKGQDINNFLTIARTGVSIIKNLMGNINIQVYNLYSKLPDKKELENNWAKLLIELKNLDVKVELNTTNYDLILEEAILGLGLINSGWRGDTVRDINTSLWEAPYHSNGKGLLTKLHGSVNWTPDGDRILVSDPTYKGSHEKHVIIYPGFKGEPRNPVFKNFHDYFANTLNMASAVIFIGYAFRDEYINNICERFIRSDATTIVINPQKNIVFPMRVTKHLDEYFDASSIDSTIKIIKSKLNS